MGKQDQGSDSVLNSHKHYYHPGINLTNETQQKKIAYNENFKLLDESLER